MCDLALLICDPLVYFSYLRCVRPLGPLLDFYALCYTFYKYCTYVTLFESRSIVVQLKCLKSSISTLSSPREPAYNWRSRQDPQRSQFSLVSECSSDSSDDEVSLVSYLVSAVEFSELE